MKLKYIINLVMMVLLIGCAFNPKDMNKIHVGMDKKDVVSILGKPTEIRSAGIFDYMVYGEPACRIKTKLCKKYKNAYFVFLRDGKVDVFGQKGMFSFDTIIDKKIRPENSY